jgi:ABC-type glutathione transport system ATPase component
VTVLRVSELAVGVPGPDGRVLVEGIDLSLDEGGAVGLTGASGAGKTLTACALCGLLPDPVRVLGGRLEIGGESVDPADRRAFRQRRGRDVFMVFQSPAGALDPISRVGEQIAEALWAVQGWARSAARREAVRLLGSVGLDRAHADRFPHQLSGGERQRVLLAIALALRPRILVADEPTSGLDQTTRDQVLALIGELRELEGTALVVISHDLRVLAGIVDELVVLHGGWQVEAGPVGGLLERPRHPHTAEIVRAMRLLEGIGP